MKQIFATMLVLAASATDYFEGITLTNAGEADKTAVVLLKDADDATIWSIETESFLEEDSGDRWIRITHTLNANIEADDIVTFDLSFSSDFDPWTDPLNMIEDSGRCIVQMDTDDNRFWATTVEDYYWTCSDVDCSNSALASAVWRSGDFTESEDTTNDWEVGITDDDPNNKFCTGMPAVAVVDSAAPTFEEYQLLEAETYYECSQIKCVHQRKLNTEDTNDFQFDETAEGSSTMTIHLDRSSVLIQASDLSDGATLPMYANLWSEQDITIYAGATTLQALACSVLLSAALV